jgi:phospholipid N-methyltransferase
MYATYSPDDNKLRLYSSTRLDAETYQRVKAAGFIWAPKQGLFVAPMWTPSREDLLIELCGEIGDEDTTLAERAEERAERFEDYRDKRTQDAERAHKAVSAIADQIPLGQPILVGHHSERHARRDAQRIENGMRHAIRMWDTANYWKSRARGAIRHAKYKELPAVRHRRIKGLESDKRKQEQHVKKANAAIKAWEVDPLTLERASTIAAYDHSIWAWSHKRPSGYEGSISIWDALQPDREQLNGILITPEQAREKAIRQHRGVIAHSERWLSHIENRLAYEREMLQDSGGITADKFDLQPGGRVLRRGEWLVITKLNRVNGVLNSVSVIGHWAATVPVDEIRDYKPPQAGDAEKVAALVKKAPLCNYPGEGFRHMTEAEWKKRLWSDFSKTRTIKSTDSHGDHRVRCTPKPQWSYDYVFLTDKKRVDPPAKDTAPALEKFTREREPSTITYKAPEPTKFDALKEQLRAGVQVVTANQLFPTPSSIVARMIDHAQIEPGHDVLEPSAGTGNILRACFHLNGEGFSGVPAAGDLVAVEINPSLTQLLANEFPKAKVVNGDFLAFNGDLGTFDRILMNPPFENAVDIKHILHARHMLKPGGRLVAICANGPRQNEQLKPIASSWEVLPPDTFKEQGTGVNTVLLTIDNDQ